MTTCAHCNKPLAYQDEAHAMDGQLFCSRECAIQYITNDIIANAKAAAIDAYNSDAEVVLTQDIIADECELVKKENSTQGFTDDIKEVFINMLIKRDGCLHKEAAELVDIASTTAARLRNTNAGADRVAYTVADILGIDKTSVFDVCRSVWE